MVNESADYGIYAEVHCATDGNNSFFLNVDAEPTSPLAIWDIPAIAQVTNRLVSWRGNGTDAASQYPQKIFTLSAGVHQLIIRGREAGAQINHISLVKVPAAPSNLTLGP